MRNRQKHMLLKRLLVGVLTAVMTLSGGFFLPESYTVYAAETDNSIINWDGLPYIDGETVATTAESGVEIQFSHPGIFASKENLDLMREMIHEGYDPWFSAFEEFRESALASKEYANTNAGRTHTYIGNADRQDANAAYMLSIMWWVTGDKDYYDIAIDIIRSYCESYDPDLFATEQEGGYGWSADIITTGMVINKFTFAAELLRYAETEVPYDNAWTQDDTDNFIEVLNMAYPLYDRTDKWMNQTAFTFQAMIASAVFRNDPDMYELVIERATVNDKASYHFADASIKWQARLVDTTATVEDLTDGDDSITLIKLEEPVIQWAEMGRDQPHAQAGLAIMSGIVQTSYIQGTEVDENGHIVTDGSGSNLFEFLDHRFLKGANYYYQYNLGYDVTWYPLAKGNESDYEALPSLVGGADNSPGWWTNVSLSGRFTLGGSGVLYYHYLYEEGLSADDPDFRYVVEAQSLQDDNFGDGDAITNATLLLAPAEAKTGDPQGPPQAKAAPGYATNTAGSGRIQATSYTGAYAGRMPTTSTPSSEYYTDDLGTRTVTNNTYKNDYLWFKDVDLGDMELDSFMLTSASNSGQGTLFRLILLDDVDIQDWSAVTREEIDQGEVLVEDYSGGTGWWSTYVTKVFEMARSLSGVHSFAFLYLGSDNVYELAANVDWMAFGNYYAYQNNAVKDAPLKQNVTVDGDNAILTDGSVFGWDAMNMDIGNSGLTMEIASTGVGTLKLYSGTPDGEHSLVSVYNVPYTGGAVMSISVPGEHLASIKGNQNVYYVYEGDSDLTISTICSYYYKESNIPTVQGEDYALISTGEITVKEDAEAQEGKYAEFKDGGIAFYRLNLYAENITFRVRTNGKAKITLTSGMGNNGDLSLEDVYRIFGILEMDVPDTHGRWVQFQYDLSEVTNRSGNVYLMVTGADMDIDCIVFDQDNSPADITNYTYSQPVFSAQKDEAYTDYLLSNQDYDVTVETFDFDNDTVTTMVILDQDYVSENGVIRLNIPQAGEYEALVVADDTKAWTLQIRNLVVADTVEALIEKVGEYDTSCSYSKKSMSEYNKALEEAKALSDGGYTEELVAALQKLSDAAAALIMRVPTEEDGSIDYITYSDYFKFSRYSSLQGGYSEDQEAILADIYNLMDNDPNSYIEWRHSQNVSPAYFMIDCTEGMGAKLEKFTLQTRNGFGSRTNGVLLEASNDGEEWVTISESGAVNTNDLQTISIKAAYQDVPFRYIRLYNPRVNESGANSFLSIAEFHIYGEIVELEPLLSFSMDGFKFTQKQGTNIWEAQMSEKLFEASEKIPVFTLTNEASLFQGETELVSGVTPITFEGTETGNGAVRTAVLTAKASDGTVQEYVIEITFNTVELSAAKGLFWSGKHAGFSASDSEENVEAYEISLYKDGELVEGSVQTIEKNDTGSYSWYYEALIQEDGNYTFKVIAKSGSDDFTDSEEVESTVKKYTPAEILTGELIASFDFEDLEAGMTEITGGGAKAEVMGNAAYEASYDGNGKAAKITSDFWLNVTKDDGTPLLAGLDEITISYDNKFGSSSNVGWTFYAAPNTDAQAGKYEKYLGILDRAAGVVVERYCLDNASRPANPTITGITSDWKHVDVVITEEETRLYIDGELAASRTSSVLLSDILTEEGGILQIGKANWGNGEYYNGLIDNLKIYARSGKADDIAALEEAESLVSEALSGYTIPQPEAETEDMAKEKVQQLVDSLELGEVDAEVVTVEGKFEAATAGSEALPEGINGNYYFVVVLSKGQADPVTTQELVAVIIATPYEKGDVSGGDVSGGDVSGGDVSGGDVSGGDADQTDKTELQKVIEEAEAIDGSDYTEESWQAVLDALAKAQEVFADETATQEEIEAAIEALKNAMAALEEIPDQPDDPDKPVDPDDPDNPDDPDDPDKPVDPDQPDNPIDPDEPDQPDQPDDPDDPNQPDDPVKPGDSGESGEVPGETESPEESQQPSGGTSESAADSSTSDSGNGEIVHSPKTGDSLFSMYLFVLMAALILTGIAIGLKKKEDSELN